MVKIYLKNQQRSKRLNHQRIKRDLSKTLRLLEFEKTELSILFVNTRRMKFLNAQYRGIKKVTDVLSFPQYDPELQNCGRKGVKYLRTSELQSLKASGHRLLGDIVICIPEAASQACTYGVTFYDELLRLLLHGLLHLLGYDHEINRYQKKKMGKKERELLNAVKAMA